MGLGDEQINRAVQGIDDVAQKRLDQLNQMIDQRLTQFQEMLNGIKVTVNIEMPMVKKAEPVDQ